MVLLIKNEKCCALRRLRKRSLCPSGHLLSDLSDLLHFSILILPIKIKPVKFFVNFFQSIKKDKWVRVVLRPLQRKYVRNDMRRAMTRIEMKIEIGNWKLMRMFCWFRVLKLRRERLSEANEEKVCGFKIVYHRIHRAVGLRS